ncbi:uncharacterized protein EV422DRAFT_570634 [Fimicolochytrium jonesii]|uniref:uncharacterized protein n=1 Tax=Fimicolochytrium jonesii TaxID=1396493 RepID=UPI0022FDD10E|nr:uncharacterized protein EV422DRAFT_570634 [Fimicolochytrium jonesii]KAI8817590.1 hypothetical protein EV422DRAFT_570634 [Fimicolochytrium jonesii]
MHAKQQNGLAAKLIFNAREFQTVQEEAKNGSARKTKRIVAFILLFVLIIVIFVIFETGVIGNMN